MLDIRYIQENADRVQEASRQKGYDVSIEDLLKLDSDRRELQSRVDDLRARRNENAAKMKGGQPDQSIIDEGKRIKVELSEQEGYLAATEKKYVDLLKQVPNIPLDDVPVGDTEEDNVVSKVVGDKPEFDFEPKNHAEIAAGLGWLDKERAAKVTGARFAYVMGGMVKLQLAVVNWVIDSLTDEAVLKRIADEAGLKVSTRPFIPVLPPLMIKTEPYDAMDRLEPRDDRYKIEGEELWLQGSAEHVLGSMHANETFESGDLPLRYLGYATSFRKEAGTYGRDMEGIIRMHQFDKLEMESFTEAKDGLNEHLFFVAIQEYLLSQLELPYQVLTKCTVDIGKPNARGVDMEVWLPGQSKYRETHTADFMTDYQARRLQTKVKTANGNELIHTNDATAFALGRIMVAIIENYQTADGRVRVPEVLRSYIGGLEQL